VEPVAGVREVELGEAGIAFVRETLVDWGGPLARELDRVDLAAGTATIFLSTEIVEVPQRLQDQPVGFSEGYPRMRRATMDKIKTHFVASNGEGWAMIGDPYGIGLGAFVNARVDGRETRFKAAWDEGPTVLYLVGAADEIDVEDFLDAAVDYGIISALGVGGPLTSLETESLDWAEDVLPHVAEHVRLIMRQAFDAQALVFWQRSAKAAAVD
jgi:hypothetical protein